MNPQLHCPVFPCLVTEEMGDSLSQPQEKWGRQPLGFRWLPLSIYLESLCPSSPARLPLSAQPFPTHHRSCPECTAQNTQLSPGPKGETDPKSAAHDPQHYLHHLQDRVKINSPAPTPVAFPLPWPSCSSDSRRFCVLTTFKLHWSDSPFTLLTGLAVYPLLFFSKETL